MSTILEKSNQILNEKNTKILPENLKKGVSFFDVAGTLEGVNAQSKEVTPSTSAQEITPDAEYNALSSVNIKAVDSTIDPNIVAENIKEGISILGISGNYKPEHIIESTGVKLFETVEDMNNSENNAEGDLALVYSTSGTTDFNETTSASKLYFPDRVVLDKQPEIVYGQFVCGLGEQYEWLIQAQANLSKTSFSISIMSQAIENGLEFQMVYRSEDGLTYIRETEESFVDIGAPMAYNNSFKWVEDFGKFMQVECNSFDGLFEYQTWVDKDEISFPLLSGMSYTDTPSVSYTGARSKAFNLDKIISLAKQIVQDETSKSTGSFGLMYKNDTPVLLAALTSSGTSLDALQQVRYYANTNSYKIWNASNGVGPVYEYVLDLNNNTYTKNYIMNKNGAGTSPLYCEINYTPESLACILAINTNNDNGYEMYSYGESIDYYNGTTTRGINADNFLKDFYDIKLSYKPANSQFNATSSGVYNDYFYGKDGADRGTLGNSISDNFDDTASLVYYKLQEEINNKETVVLTDDNKTLNKNIRVLPKRSDGSAVYDGSAITSARYMFLNYYKLEAIDGLEMSDCTDYSCFCQNNQSLKRTCLFDTSKATAFNSMYSGCNLETLPAYNTSNVTNFSSMLQSNFRLKNVPILDTSNAENMSNMFSNCNQFTDESLNNILQMCINATKITTKTLKYIGFTSYVANKCLTLSNYQAFLDAGWTTGY